MLFIAFSGEEKGLLGSSYYVKHPALPLNSCVAMINLDTVGRLLDGPLTVFGSPSAQEFKHIVQGVNYGFGFELELPEKEMDASDHASFTKAGVPAIQVFTGPHEDYHRPGDTPGHNSFVERFHAQPFWGRVLRGPPSAVSGLSRGLFTGHQG